MNDLHNAEPPQSFKVWSILVHLNSLFLPFFASLQSPSLSAGQFRERTHVRNLLLALYRSHSPSLLLGKADLDRKKLDLYLGGLARIKENCIIFFNKFQHVSSLSKHLHLQRQWRVWPRRTGRNSLIYAL